MNVRDLIDQLNRFAESLPDGLDSEVRVHLCNGHDTPGVLTKMVGVASGQSGHGEERTSQVLVEAHPHADDENTELRPAAMGVDDELVRLVEGEAPPRPLAATIAIGDTGQAVNIPLDQDGRKPLLPGAPEAVDEGCTCDPAKNNHGSGIEVPENDGIAFIYNQTCPLHQQVRLDPNKET